MSRYTAFYATRPDSLDLLLSLEKRAPLYYVRWGHYSSRAELVPCPGAPAGGRIRCCSSRNSPCSVRGALLCVLRRGGIVSWSRRRGLTPRGHKPFHSTRRRTLP